MSLLCSESSVSDCHDSLEDANRDKVLHLPGNLLSFANWAFGSDGLSLLRILAFGDFSYDNLFQFNNHVFCRHTWSIRDPDTNKQTVFTFRLVRGTDYELWSIIYHHMDFWVRVQALTGAKSY
jgi:hypothetical protein